MRDKRASAGRLENMLSSVSYVCLGVCAGMWVISRGIYLGVLVFSFISVLLFQRSGHFCLFLTFYCVCVSLGARECAVSG